jgi:uncharacterized protein involved in exopolysaccharide biosynthesis
MEAIFRRQRLWWTVFLTILVVTAAVIVLMPRRYESTAKLVVSNLRTHSTLSAGPVSRVVTTEDVSQSQINSEVDLLKSQTVIRAALGLPSTPAANARDAEDQQKTVKRIQDHLSIDPVRESSIIDVKLVDHSPAEALNHLNAILDSYLNQRKVLTQSANAVDFFDRQAQAFSADLDKAREALTKFEQSHDLVDMDQQQKLQIERVAAIEDRISAAKATLANQGSRTRTLLNRLALTPSRTETVRHSLTNQYSQERLNTSLVDLVNRRDELLRRYPPSDRAVLALDQSIAVTRAAIKEAADQPAQDTATDVNPVWQTITTNLVGSSADVSGFTAEQKELESQRATAEARLQALLQSTEAYETLRRRLTEAQNGYNLYVQKRDEARVGEALDKDQLFDVSLVQHPIVSTVPVRPQPVAYALAGFILALLLASALAVYADTTDDLVYTPQQLDSVTGVRTSGTLAETLDDTVARENEMEFRRLVASIRSTLAHRHADDSPQPQRVAVTSALEGEGVTWIARHLALEAAKQVKLRVALLDMTALLKKIGIGDHILVALAKDPTSLCWEFVFPATPDPSLLMLGEIGSQNFWGDLEPALIRASRQFDLIFFDCPSLRDSTLAADLDGLVDGYVAVVSAASARKQQIRQMVSFLQHTDTPVLGYLLNRRTYPVPPWLYRFL